MLKVPILFNEVYFVESKPPKSAAMIAIRPEIQAEYMEWEDTNRGHYVNIDKIKVEPDMPDNDDGTFTPDKILVVSREGEKFIFSKLTLDLYNQKVREWVWGQPKFESEKELKDYYLDTDFQAY